MCRCNKSPCSYLNSHSAQIAELEEWLKEHPDADIEAVREVRRKLTELQNEINYTND